MDRIVELSKSEILHCKETPGGHTPSGAIQFEGRVTCPVFRVVHLLGGLQTRLYEFMAVDPKSAATNGAGNGTMAEEKVKEDDVDAIAGKKKKEK